MKTLLIRTLSGAFYVATIMVPLLWADALYPWIIFAYAVLIGVEMMRLLRKTQKNNRLITRVSTFLLLLFWALLPMALLAMMPWILNVFVPSRGIELTVLMFLMVWTYDTFAYLTGKIAGRHLLWPSVSPKKTAEGVVGGTLATLILVLLLSRSFTEEVQVWYWLVSVLLIVVFGTTGDLLESYLKRRAGVKDSGSIMPGHGGIFDRFDALLLVSPVWIFWLWLVSQWF